MNIVLRTKDNFIRLISFLLQFFTTLELFILIPYGFFIASKIISSSNQKSDCIIFQIYFLVAAILMSICDRFNIPILNQDDCWKIDSSNSIVNGTSNFFRLIIGYSQLPEELTNLPRYIGVIPLKVCSSYRINMRDKVK